MGASVLLLLFMVVQWAQTNPVPAIVLAVIAAIGLIVVVAVWAQASGTPSSAGDVASISASERPFLSAEHAAAQHMRVLGFSDAKCTSAGADGGIDVESARAVAQVKWHSRPVGVEYVQRLKGTALGKGALFYSRNGYTDAASRWATTAGVALFLLGDDGGARALNQPARALVASRPGSPR